LKKKFLKGGTTSGQKIPQSARIPQVREKAKILKEKIGMHTFPVGVKLIFQKDIAIIDKVAKLKV